MNRPISLAMKGLAPRIAQVTVVPSPDGESVKSTMLLARNGFSKSSLSATYDDGAEFVISIRPLPALELPSQA
jgi:hypothetical protein